METGHPSTRAVNSGSGNRALSTITVSDTPGQDGMQQEEVGGVGTHSVY